MSGHNKWSSIKHQKGVADAKRGRIFTKLTREIIQSVRQGGANPEANFHLRLAMQKARDSNMPIDNIDRAIKRGEGNLEGTSMVEMILEGYGPGGAAIMVEAISDNRNRTVQEVRSMFTRAGGNLAESGSVTWLFDNRGIIVVDTGESDPDEIALHAIDAGADDVDPGEGYIEIYTRPDAMFPIRAALEKKGLTITSAEVTKVPKSTIKLDEAGSLQVLKLMDKLEELDETTSVASNVDFSDDVLSKYRSQ